MKSKWIAGILSFVFPGIGHLYLGKVSKGIFLIIANIISILLTSVVVGIFMFLIVWVYAIIDSIKETSIRNSYAKAS
ncbi:DUF6677 family protein [Bacillus xiapuensis]|uniref:DUF6677 family protein n=1 Tax=Bacillus xiapuensis TaxID=2014075 RepID=UPI000C25117F|nr:DUF6677 family protein [Bacillus xiapuensis]